jgi:hypothetical protein
MLSLSKHERRFHTPFDKLRVAAMAFSSTVARPRHKRLFTLAKPVSPPPVFYR